MDLNNMQNFREYYESEVEYGKLFYSIQFFVNVKLQSLTAAAGQRENLAVIRNQIKNALKEVGLARDTFSSNDTNKQSFFTLDVKLENKKWSKAELLAVKEKTIKAIKSVPQFKDKEFEFDSDCIVVTGTLHPSSSIEWDNVDLVYTTNEISLVNIDKQLKNVKHLKIFLSSSVSVLEGGLGILKMLSLKSFIIELPRPPEWLKIIKAHFDADKNISKAQTELFKNGFKEYAKL
jgi:hypothetical protein